MTRRPTTLLLNHASAAYRRKRFRLAAAFHSWWRLLAVVVALWVLFSTMDQGQLRMWVGVGYALIATGYFWLDVHYGARSLNRRFEANQRRRELRRRLAL